MLVARSVIIALLVAALSVGAAGAVAAAADGQAVTHTVAADGSADFTSIQEAVDAADHGDVVALRPGSYNGPVVIDKDLDLIGDGPREDVVIAAPTELSSEGGLPGSGRPYALWLSGEAVSISGLTVATPDLTTGLVSTAGSPLIEQVSFVGPEEAGQRSTARTHKPFRSMEFFGDTRPTIRDSEWDGYVAVRDGAAAVFVGNTVRGDTISIDGPGESSVRDSRFERGSISMSWGVSGVIEGNEFVGDLTQVGVDSGSNVEVRGNVFDGSADDAAIWVEGGDTTAAVSGNTVIDAVNAVRISGGAAVRVEANMLQATLIGIAVTGTDAVIDSNTIDSDGAGITIAGGADPTITGNTVDAGRSAIVVARASAPEITGNSLCGDEEGIVVADGATPRIGDNEMC